LLQETSSEEKSRPTACVSGANMLQEPTPPLVQLPTTTNEYIELPNSRTLHVMTIDVPSHHEIFDSYPRNIFVLTDVPGINMQDPQDIYKQFVNVQWESFDCVVVVLNALEEVLVQLDMLHLVKENLSSKRKTPVVFVCNKVDDVTNQKAMTTFEQLRKIVWSIFRTSRTFIIVLFFTTHVDLYF
jgi:hypothetical protein